MIVGTIGCALDTVGIVLKYFRPQSERIWPLYTLLVLLGWTMYAPAQLTVLYSRLHLISQNEKLQRWVLGMIIMVSAAMILPTWPLAWMAWNPYNKRMSSLFSSSEAIIDRITQLGYTAAESIIGVIYIRSLLRLLHLKSSVRQRRVMSDLIIVNVIAVSLDILTVILVFLNRSGISHPIQAFGYALKFKLEFVVLNQLMAVAAKGIRGESFAERRYHHPSVTSDKHSPPVSSKDSTMDSKPLPDLPFVHDTEQPKKHGSSKTNVSASVFGHARTRHDDELDYSNARLSKSRRKYHHVLAGKSSSSEETEDSDEEIGAHMWSRNGHLVGQIPWFKTVTNV